MKFIFLSATFFSEYSQSDFPEIIHKENRPYVAIEIEIDKKRFAIPLRSNIKHKWQYKLKSTDNSGLDFTKAILLSDDAYISDIQPHIKDNDFNFLKGKEHIVEKRFMKYIREYVVAINSTDSNKKGAEKYSTLPYFSHLVDYEQLVNKYFELSTTE